MKRRINRDQVMAMAQGLPSSPRDRKISILEKAAFAFYALAGICAWQLGGWWGLGLVVCLFLIDTFNATTQEEYRQELVEMHGKLVLQIAENSDILEDVVPMERGAYE